MVLIVYVLVGIWKGSKMCHLYFWDKQVWDNLATKRELTLRNEKKNVMLAGDFVFKIKNNVAHNKVLFEEMKMIVNKWYNSLFPA